MDEYTRILFKKILQKNAECFGVPEKEIDEVLSVMHKIISDAGFRMRLEKVA